MDSCGGLHFSLKTEGLRIARRATPLVVAAFCVQVQTIWAAALAGSKLGPAALGAIVMASMLGNLTLRSVIAGTLSGYDALAANSFGSKDFAQVGLLAQRATLVTLAFFPPMYTLWLFIEPLLLLLGQPAEVVVLVAIFLKISMLGFPAILLNQVLNKFLVVQGRPVDGLTAVAIATNVILHPLLLSWALSVIGFPGAAWSSVLVDWVRFVGGILYLWTCSQHDPRTWDGFRIREALSPSGLKAYWQLALPGVLGMNESWYWEAMGFLVGLGGTSDLAAHSIAYSFMPFVGGGLPISVGGVLGARVVALLGENRFVESRHLARVGLGVAAGIQILCGIFAWLARDWIVARFTDSPETASLACVIWPLISLGALGGGFFNLQAALLRSVGLHSRIAKTTSVVLWGLALPLEYVIGVVLRARVTGIWIVHAALRLLLMNPLLFISVWFLDWASQGVKLRQLRETDKAQPKHQRPQVYGVLEEDKMADAKQERKKKARISRH